MVTQMFFNQKSQGTNIFIFIFLSASKRQHLRFYRSFFSLFHFSQNFTFPKKIPFCHFYPQTTIPPSLLQIVFCTFSLFPKKNPFCQFVISTHKQQYPQHFYRSFFALFHFSQKKFHFVNSTQASTDHFFHYFTFPKSDILFIGLKIFMNLGLKTCHVTSDMKANNLIQSLMNIGLVRNHLNLVFQY